MDEGERGEARAWPKWRHEEMRDALERGDYVGVEASAVTCALEATQMLKETGKPQAAIVRVACMAFAASAAHAARDPDKTLVFFYAAKGAIAEARAVAGFSTDDALDLSLQEKKVEDLRRTLEAMGLQTHHDPPKYWNAWLRKRETARDGEDKGAWHKRRLREYADAREKNDHALAMRIALSAAREAHERLERGDAEAAYVHLSFIGFAAYAAHAARQTKNSVYLYYRCKAALGELQLDDSFAAKWATHVATIARKMREFADTLEYMGIDTTRNPQDFESIRWSDVARRLIDHDSDYERDQRKNT